MYPITEVSDVDINFSGSVRHLMPVYEEIPEEFHDANNPYSKVASSWFYGGLPGDTTFEPREGVDTRKALRHVAAILRSFEPKHEHKISAAGYLLSEWFKQILIPKKNG